MRTYSKALADALWPVSRQRVLGLLLGDPECEYHVREIVRRTGLAPASVHREALSLFGAGVLARRESGRQVYYRADRTCPIFAELQGIVLKTVGLADVLRDALLPLREHIGAAFVFGSIAEGGGDSGSDVDLMVVSALPLAEVVAALRPAGERLGREINPVRTTPEEFSGGLQCGDHFLQSVMDGPKIFLIGDRNALERVAEKRPSAEP
jgi:DNA-binding transcriptional ArsR family regulator